ncbi:MAG: hypothetical protein OEX98_09205 [Nitrosopumilus sp.]|nr:hypothetical protein [Nitrosopumilus sp.]
MNRLFTVLLTITILLTTSIVTSAGIIPDAEAMKAQGISVSKYGPQTKNQVCGDRLCSEIPGGRQAYEEQDSEFSPTVTQKRMSGETCNCAGDCTCGIDGVCNCTGEEGPCVCGPSCTCGTSMHGSDGTCMCGQMSHGKSDGHAMKTESGTMTSSQDPGLGHENHQLAVLLPPSDDLYKGMLTYSASENIQLVVLHGPLAEGEDRGQPTWTPDGETKFALTLVNPQNKAGSWMFTGNALAVHTMNSDPFTISYSAHYAKVSNSFGMSGTCYCADDCSCDKDGMCTCSGEQGACMCGPNCTCGTDGQCQCATGCSCDKDGNCTCPNNADGMCMCGSNCTCGTSVHGSDGTCSCGQIYHSKSMSHSMTAVSGTITSSQDPGLGHENHQLAVLLPPRDNEHSGLLTYAASENIQLVVLHGPLAEGEDRGQPTWTPDGETKFALTLVNPQNKAGSWMFTGNALAVHTMNSDPFTVSYSIVTMDSSGTIKDGTCQCSGDCNCSADGVCNCAGIDGPCMCGSHCNCGQ